MVNTQEMMFNLVIIIVAVVIQSPNHVQFFTTPWVAALQVSLFITTYQTLSKFMAIESVMPFNHIILCHLHLLLPSIFLSIRVFSKEYSVLISIKTDWFDLLKIKGFSGVLSSTTVQKHQFFGAQPSLCSNSHIHI